MLFNYFILRAQPDPHTQMISTPKPSSEEKEEETMTVEGTNRRISMRKERHPGTPLFPSDGQQSWACSLGSLDLWNP